MQRPGTRVLASSASAVEVVGLGYQVVEVPEWKVGGVGDVPLGAVPEEDGVFLVGLGGEAQDVPRYQSMTVDLVEGWRPRPDLLQESRKGGMSPWACCMHAKNICSRRVAVMLRKCGTGVVVILQNSCFLADGCLGKSAYLLLWLEEMKGIRSTKTCFIKLLDLSLKIQEDDK